MELDNLGWIINNNLTPGRVHITGTDIPEEITIGIGVARVLYGITSKGISVSRMHDRCLLPQLRSQATAWIENYLVPFGLVEECGTQNDETCYRRTQKANSARYQLEFE